MSKDCYAMKLLNDKKDIDSIIADAKNKQQRNPSKYLANTISFTEKEIYIGINVDQTFSIVMDDKDIGICSISETEDKEEIFLEWIEFSKEYRDKHLLRPTLLALAKYCDVDQIVFESSESNVEKYIQLGAVKTSYDEFREMQGFKISVYNLQKNLKHQLDTSDYDFRGV